MSPLTWKNQIISYTPRSCVMQTIIRGIRHIALFFVRNLNQKRQQRKTLSFYQKSSVPDPTGERGVRIPSFLGNVLDEESISLRFRTKSPEMKSPKDVFACVVRRATTSRNNLACGCSNNQQSPITNKQTNNRTRRVKRLFFRVSDARRQ